MPRSGEKTASADSSHELSIPRIIDFSTCCRHHFRLRLLISDKKNSFERLDRRLKLAVLNRLKAKPQPKFLRILQPGPIALHPQFYFILQRKLDNYIGNHAAFMNNFSRWRVIFRSRQTERVVITKRINALHRTLSERSF